MSTESRKERVRKIIPPAVAVTGGVYILLAPSEPLVLSLFLKALPMFLIIAYAVLLLPDDGLRVQYLVVGGLIFCVVGDVTLHWFVVGLTAFLVGHVFYAVGFFTRARVTRLGLVSSVPFAVYALVVGTFLITALLGDGDTELVVPVAVYLAVVTTMAWSAVLTGNRRAVAGSLLFVASDTVLSWNMFVEPLPFSGAIVMVTYYSAQYLIASSVERFG
ncbi:MAG: lysoplasmalogenase [Halobacteriales archaeon]|nr:lysoplasmalogenase [Halobacteriales archaeon]